MNRFLTLLLMSSFVLGQSWAQTTFNVDMTCAPEGFDNVFVTGPWCGWCANDTYNTMTDPDGDGVYTVEVADLMGTVEYKYAINGFADQENLVNDMVDGATCAPVTDYSGYANRTTEAGSTTNDYYGTCDGTCNDVPPPPGGSVLFRVDMSEYTGGYGTVNLNGSFNGWCGSCAPMSDDDGDMIYELAVDLQGGTIEYKFTLDGWTFQEEFTDGDPCTSNLDGYINRTIEVSGDTLLPPVCWNSCDVCEGPYTLWDVISQSPDHTMMATALAATGLTSVVDGQQLLTAMAPTDAAFIALVEALEITFGDLLTLESFDEILAYHMFAGEVFSSDLTDGQVITTLQGSDVVIGINQDGVFVNDAQMTVADIVAENGVLHVIDGILLPPATSTTVFDIVANSNDHGIMEAALVASGLEETLLGEGPFTVFAPTDAAFAELSLLTGLTVDELLGLQGMTDLLLGHVVAADVLSTDLSDGQSITTLLGNDISVGIISSSVFINNAQVTTADLVGDNGVVHVIDAVMFSDVSLFDIVGCTDPSACNYAPFASTDDGSCEYPGLGLCCSGGLDLNQNGICDEAECGEGGAYSDASYLIPDEPGQCVTSEIVVNTYPEGAVLSDASAGIEHFMINMEHSYMGDLTITFECPNGQSMMVHQQGGGSTFLGVPVDNDTDPGTPGTGFDYYWAPDATNGTWVDNAQGTLPSGTYESVETWGNLDGCPLNGVWQLEICDLWGSDNGFVFGWGVQFAGLNECCDFDEDGICDDEDDCVFCGCTDGSALNYDAEALVENGSCIYFQETCQFIGEEAWTDVEMGVHAPDSNIFIHGEEGFRELVLNLPLLVQEPTTGQSFAATELRDLTVTGLPLGLELLGLPDSITPSNQVCLELTGIPEQVGEYQAHVLGELEVVLFGQPFVVGSVSLPFAVHVLPNPNPIAGCAYPNAVNYVAYATVDNGSCLYAGCTDPVALNYYSLFVLDDGSCIYGEVQDNTCPTDVDADGVVSTTDLLELLGSFGTLCD